jgi:hypothetical protein
MRAWLWFIAAVLLFPAVVLAQRNAPPEAPFVLEHSYWIRAGQTDRFIELFNRNKLPLLRREMTDGRILWLRMTRPRLRSSDPDQPDWRLTVAWRNSVVAWDDLDPSRYVSELYRDPRLREREEREREELVLRRSDVPVQETVVVRE